MTATVIWRRLILSFFVMLLSGGGAFSANCDPNAILRSNVSQYNENMVVWLSYVKDLQRTTDSSNSSSIGVSYDGFGLDYANANSLYQYVTDHENYSLSASDSISILRSTLSPDSVRAYIACLNSNNPVTIFVPDVATTEVNFPITVEWNPNYPAKDNQQLTISVINGKVDGKVQETVRMNRTDQKSFQISRDNNGANRLFITASIFGKVSDPATLPGIPTFKLTLKPKFEPPLDKPATAICRSGGCGTTYVKIPICVYPDTGSILLPSTLKFVADKLVGDPRRSHAGVLDGNDGYHACGFIDSSAGANEDYNYISGRFLAAETYLEPIVPGAAPISPKMSTRTNRLENWEKIMNEAKPTE